MVLLEVDHLGVDLQAVVLRAVAVPVVAFLLPARRVEAAVQLRVPRGPLAGGQGVEPRVYLR